ncbi:hypothetical protein HPB50_028681 [Hyalomma asiaticum]|nr:hypothetical protein HPB50_028681 [Hyalomma asiaticum]
MGTQESSSRDAQRLTSRPEIAAKSSRWILHIGRFPAFPDQARSGAADLRVRVALGEINAPTLSFADLVADRRDDVHLVLPSAGPSGVPAPPSDFSCAQ